MLRLKAERLARGWSQTKVSGLTGIASPDLSAIERRVRPAFPSWRRRLAVAFKLPEEVLFAEIPEETVATVATLERRAK
jgi:transcriptional regulator with XRE-family HTH domain